MSELVLVTGASGFTGPHVVERLRGAGYRLRLALRREVSVPDGVETVPVGDLAHPVDWGPALAGVDHVVHLAGLAHAGPGLDEDLYRRINTRASADLGAAAAAAGVRRFVYLSSIKAVTAAQQGALTDGTAAEPGDAYGRSKHAAEQALAALDLDWVSLRPALVYGPGVKANMAALLRLARLPVPLPFGALTAPRSLLAVENLAEAVLFALNPQCPARRAYLVADPEPIGVAQMIAAMRAGLGRRPGLLPVPAGLLGGLARMAGRADAIERLAGGLTVAPDDLLRAGWRPPAETREALARLARHGG